MEFEQKAQKWRISHPWGTGTCPGSRGTVLATPCRGQKGKVREEPEQSPCLSFQVWPPLSSIPSPNPGRSLSWSQGPPFLAQVGLGESEYERELWPVPALTATEQDMCPLSPHFLICNSDNHTYWKLKIQALPSAPPFSAPLPPAPRTISMFPPFSTPAPLAPLSACTASLPLA